MDYNFLELQKLILKSDLSQEDQKNLLALFSRAKDEDLKDIVNLFATNTKYIEIISNVHKAKSKALREKDKKAWREILKQEYKGLEALEKAPQ